MLRIKAGTTLKAAVIAGALMLAPITSQAQNADSTAANYGDNRGGRGFNWGWLGLLGLLGLWPRKKTTVTETRTTAAPR